jgi:tRNA-2-methylthio-N6-dimethylallyladenosine synthase
MPGHVPEEVKTERLQRLQALLGAQQQDFNRSCVGTSMDVLFERRGTRAGQIVGRSPYLQSVQVDAGPDLIGAIRTVEIAATATWSLHGRLTHERVEEEVA